MKKTLVFAPLCVFTAVTFSGCTDFSSPRGVVLTAGYAVSINDLQSFRETLTGEALKRFGNAAAMAKLKKDFAGVKKLSTGYSILLDSQQDGALTHNAYVIDVLDHDHRLITAYVNCVVEKIRVEHKKKPAGPQDTLPSLPAGPQVAFMDWPTCKIARLN